MVKKCINIPTRMAPYLEKDLEFPVEADVRRVVATCDTVEWSKDCYLKPDREWGCRVWMAVN